MEASNEHLEGHRVHIPALLLLLFIYLFIKFTYCPENYTEQANFPWFSKGVPENWLVPQILTGENIDSDVIAFLKAHGGSGIMRSPGFLPYKGALGLFTLPLPCTKEASTCDFKNKPHGSMLLLSSGNSSLPNPP